MNFFKKNILLIIIFSLIFLNGYFFRTNTAEAVLPTVDVKAIFNLVKQQAQAKLQWLKDHWMDELMDIIVARIINNFNEETVKWVQGVGDEKGPKYVTDWEGFVKDAGKIAQDQVIQDIGLASLCTPFQARLKFDLTPVDRYQERISCTFDDIGQNLEDFYHDFRKGGWLGYNEMWQPQNNYFGQIIMATDELTIRAAKGMEARKNEAVASKGFLSIKRCLEFDNNSQAAKDFEFCISDAENSGRSTEEIQKMKTSCSITAGRQIPCLKEEIITPGDVVAGAMGDMVRADREKTYNSRSVKALYDLLANIINASLNRITKEGIGYFKESIKEEDTSKDLIGRENRRQKEEMITEVNKLVKEWQYVFDRKSKSLSYEEQLIVILQDINNRNCQPPVSSGEISQIQAEIDRLKNEITPLQAQLNEANNLIKTINEADLNNTRTRYLVIDQYSQFTSKYNTDEMFDQIYNGTARKAADDEMKNKQTELNDAQTRLNICIIQTQQMKAL